MQFAYEITGDTANVCIVCETPEEVAKYQAKGWYISSEPIIWADKMYVNGQLFDRPKQPEPELPQPTLEDAKQQKWFDIKMKRDSEERSPLPFLNKLLDFDSISSERLAWAIDAARTAVMAGQSFSVEWTCTDNSVLPMTEQDILGIPIAVAQRSDTLHKKARAMKAQIDSATTKEDVYAITW